MPYCPDCGRHVAPGDDACPECGLDIAAALAGGGPTGPASAPEPRSGDDSPPPRPSGDDPVSRRRALAAGGGVLAAMVAGTYALEHVGQDGPVEVVGAWRDAWASGDAETFRSLWHADGRLNDWPGDAADRPAAPDASLAYVGQERTVRHRGADRAVVEDVFLLDHPDYEDWRLLTTVVDLRTEDDRWRIWTERVTDVTRRPDCRRHFSITGSVHIDCA